MAHFVIDELDKLSKAELKRLNSIEALNIELRISVAQRAEMASRHAAFTRGMGQAEFASSDWSSGIRSNFDLYCELMINDIPFVRTDKRLRFSLQDAEALTDDRIMEISEAGGADLALGDVRRDLMLRSHEAWLSTLSDDDREAYGLGADNRSNWELYCDNRLNGIPLSRPTLATVRTTATAASI